MLVGAALCVRRPGRAVRSQQPSNVPFRRIEALRDTPATEWSIDGLVRVVHHVFPNVIVAELSHHTTLAILEPLAPDRTNLVTYTLTSRPQGNDREHARRSAERDFAFVAQGTAEDRAIALRVPSVQQ